MARKTKIETAFGLVTAVLTAVFIVLLVLTAIGEARISVKGFSLPGKVLSPNEADLEISDEVKNALLSYWDDSGVNEYGACIDVDNRLAYSPDGQRYDNITYDFSDTSDYVLGQENFVRARSCSEGVIHKHPDGDCSPSIWLGDAEHARQHFSRGGSFYLVHCSRGVIEVYTRDTTLDGVLVRID